MNFTCLIQTLKLVEFGSNWSRCISILPKVFQLFWLVEVNNETKITIFDGFLFRCTEVSFRQRQFCVKKLNLKRKFDKTITTRILTYFQKFNTKNISLSIREKNV